MNEKNDSVASFLNEFAEPKDIFKEETQVETEPEVEEKEEKVPFHKDPKVQRYIEKQVEKSLKDRAPSAEKQFKDDIKDINLPDSFVRLIGNDTDEKRQVLKDMSDYLSSLPKKAKEEFLEEQRQAVAAQEAADRQAAEELDNYFEEIEEQFNVDLSSKSASAKALRSQFVEYVRKIAPKDANGEVTGFPDLVASFEEFQERNKRPATRAKELANRGMTRSGETTATMPQGRSWKDVDRFFDKLKASN